MNETAAPSNTAVRGPNGSILTFADLPSPDFKQRWHVRHKATVLAAVRGGLINLETACSRYRLNPEELLSWQHYLDSYGFLALRARKVQSYPRLGQLQQKQSGDRRSYRSTRGPFGDLNCRRAIFDTAPQSV
jgi:hypothetical protein